MKIKTDFVTNSSSTSFILLVDERNRTKNELTEFLLEVLKKDWDNVTIVRDKYDFDEMEKDGETILTYSDDDFHKIEYLAFKKASENKNITAISIDTDLSEKAKVAAIKKVAKLKGYTIVHEEGD